MVGTGMGMALKKGASTGGVDIIQKILLKYLKIPFLQTIHILPQKLTYTNPQANNSQYDFLKNLQFDIIF